MSKRDKLLTAILNNPADVRFEDACKAAGWLDFKWKGGKGSHAAFSKTGEPTELNFQNVKGRIPAYQARQLGVMIEKYWDATPSDETEIQSPAKERKKKSPSADKD